LWPSYDIILNANTVSNLLLIALACAWGGGALFRVYRQARYYQIEEYKSARYGRWLLSQRERWLPQRALLWSAVGVVLAFFTDSIPGQTSILPYILATVAALVAVWPPAESEIKKAFRPTPRAQRLLGAAFTLTVVFLLLLIVFITPLVGDSDRLRAVSTAFAGLLTLLLAPAWLMLANLLLAPIEARIRRGFVKQARAVMQAVRPKVIGITGSYGKTTTKNFLRDILNGRYKTYATPKSYNTMMGVSMAINNDLADDYSIEYFISEMGAYIPGEIARLCDLTPPDIGVIIEVGPQHLERFGSLENIAIAKYELIKAVPKDGLGVFNWDNPYIRDMLARGYPDKRIAVSKTLTPDEAKGQGVRFVATDVQHGLEGLRFTLHDTQTGASEALQTPVVGEHNVVNLLLAAAVAVHEGMTLRDVALRARSLQPAESRLVRQTTEAGITIINDAYSANPVGVVSALKVLGMHTGGRRVLITPGMVELANLHEQENKRLGQIATQYATDIILVGAVQTQPIRDGVLSGGFPTERLQVVEHLSEAVAWYQQHLRSGDTVLFLNDLPDTY
jgi:UDP-N-acetylmuramoyl-tripeptide--D-alanyl-D-alanine ligase